MGELGVSCMGEQKVYIIMYGGTGSWLYGELIWGLHIVQLSSGSDLGMLLVDHLKSNKTPVSDELLG